MNYEALVALSILTWRIIATIREPVLSWVKTRLENGFATYGNDFYRAFVWTIAFVVGYGYATMAGPDGDMLQALGWTDGYAEIGYAMTAGLIASGSAGLRVAEKLFDAKTDND